MQNEAVQQRAKLVRKELQDINRNSSKVLGPYNEARNRWRQYVWKNERDIAWVLDPVITVHPDEIFFECFSQDESSYGRLGCSYEVLKTLMSLNVARRISIIQMHFITNFKK